MVKRVPNARKIDTQPIGHSAQVRAGLGSTAEVPWRSQQAQESIMCEIGCISSTAQPPAQPSLQPVMVVTVKMFEVFDGWRDILRNAHARTLSSSII